MILCVLDCWISLFQRGTELASRKPLKKIAFSYVKRVELSDANPYSSVYFSYLFPAAEFVESE